MKSFNEEHLKVVEVVNTKHFFCINIYFILTVTFYFILHQTWF